VRYLSMARKALHFFAISVGLMQCYTIGLLLSDETMTVQTHIGGHLTLLFGLLFMTGIFATCLVRDKFSMINLHESAFDDLVWNLMAILATGLYEPGIALIVL